MSAAMDRPPELLFARHGATAPNLAGLRCGGDLDVPLADAGRSQARSLALLVAAAQPPVGLIVTSGLKRTVETAQIISAALGGVTIVTEPLLAERRLGAWNLLPVTQTAPWFEAGMTPPGGESNEEFSARITSTVRRRLLPLLQRRPLLVGSRGVARVLGEWTGVASNALGNAELITFPMTRLPSPVTAGDEA